MYIRPVVYGTVVHGEHDVNISVIQGGSISFEPQYDSMEIPSR
jgi:hypothetical protein